MTKTTILILAANPKDTSRVRLDQEVREIGEGLRRARKRNKFILKQVWATRPIDVRRAMLDYKPNIVHFCGHGKGEEGIVLEDDTGKMRLVRADILSEFFSLFADKVNCVILNACYTKTQADAIAQNISYVIGMEKAMGDNSAIQFAVALYDALGAGESIKFAFQLASNAIKWEESQAATPILKVRTQNIEQLIKNGQGGLNAELKESGFYQYLKKPILKSIDDDKKFKNLCNGYWVYDKFIKTLLDNGWIRFAAGFKAGLYAHQKYHWCIKTLGLGVGEDPAYFCERGWYLEHERNMLIDFKKAGFSFQPNVMSQEESIEFLVTECGVDRNQATRRSTNDDILILEYLPSIPLLTQTGRLLECEIHPYLMNNQVLKDIGFALESLKVQLDDANAQGLLHNDPIGFNILFTLDSDNNVIAKLVDFELAQNLNKSSPEHVNVSIEQLYKERNVLFNQQTSQYTKNLDQHLMEESIHIVEQLSTKLKNLNDSKLPFYSISTIGPFSSGIEIKLKNVVEYLRKQ